MKKLCFNFTISLFFFGFNQAFSDEIASETNFFAQIWAKFSALTNLNYSTSFPNPECNNSKTSAVKSTLPLASLPPEKDSQAWLFKSDENPQIKPPELGCVTGEDLRTERCYPSFLEDLRTGKTSIDEMKKQRPYRFDIIGQGKEFIDRRVFQFHHQNFARQDTGLTILDGYHNTDKAVSHITEAVFIPRDQVPSYKVDKKNNEINVTLANKEKIIFDLTTGKIKAGVLSESPVKVGSAGTFTYSGKNIMIQTIGLDGNSKSHMETATKATIHKVGFAPCSVPFEKLWSRPIGSRDAHFKFPTDKAFYAWLNNESGCFK